MTSQGGVIDPPRWSSRSAIITQHAPNSKMAEDSGPLGATSSGDMSQISDLLVNVYPRLANICGGWMLHKSTGVSGRRNLVVIPPDLHGYTGQQLKVCTSRTERVDLSCSAEEESCKEHDEFTDSTCNQSDQTSECPVCNNAFHVDIIEVHAATCGLRPSDNDSHESRGSGAVGQISTFQSRICETDRGT
ncbi:hypothetical protein MHYP_G00246770 [Metynnis hypsauchen]